MDKKKCCGGYSVKNSGAQKIKAPYAAKSKHTKTVVKKGNDLRSGK